MMEVDIVCSHDVHGLIGRGGGLPWPGERYPSALVEDMRSMRKVTKGKPVIMGRKAWDCMMTILPNRTCIVVSRSMSPSRTDCIVVDSPEKAYARAKQEMPDQTPVVIGGASMFSFFKKHLRFFYRTYVLAHSLEGDTHLDPWYTDSKTRWAWADKNFGGYHEEEGFAYEIKQLRLIGEQT